jgi:hypothetical protein
MRCYFIVASGSINYIFYQSEFILDQIRRHTNLNKVEFIVADDVNFEELEPFSIVFMLGRSLPSKKRYESIYLVLLNFSPIKYVEDFNCDEVGTKKIAHERANLMQKIHNIDCLLDFGKWQSEEFKEVVSFVSHFYSGTSEIDLSKREIRYDVGFVGELTPRRIRIFEELSNSGLKMSPFSGLATEEIMSLSRIAVNLRSNEMPNLEVPRILAALANRIPLVSEISHLNSEIESKFFTSCSYEEIVQNVLTVDRNIRQYEQLAVKGHKWYQEIYLPAAEKSWELLMNSIETDAMNKFSRMFSGVYTLYKSRLDY